MGVALPRISANYPGGFTNGITIRGVPLIMTNPGETFWVDENASSTGRGTFKNPDTSINTCMARCVSGRGDVIMVKPGHIENIAAAGDLACDVVGVAIVGTGRGDDQAKIVFDTADTASITVTVANVSFINMWFEADFENVDGAIDVAAGGDYFTIDGCRVTATTTAHDFETFCTLAVGANYFGFYNNDVHLIEGTDGENLITTVGESLAMRVIGNIIVMEASLSIFDVDAAAITGGPVFKDNVMINLLAAADFCVEIAAATVGIFVGERYVCASGVVPVADVSASFFIDCKACDAVAISSLEFPAATTAW